MTNNLLSRKGCPYQVDELAQLAQDIDFASCLYWAKIFPPLSTPTTLRLDNYSDAFRAAYAAHELQKCDPLIARACENSAPFCWSDAVFQTAPSYLREAREHGIRYGFTIPLWNHPGSVGMLTFSRPETAVAAAELKAALKHVVLSGYEMHRAMIKWFNANCRPGQTLRFSDRERMILKWTADGKTSAEVASILGVKQRTINFHIGNAMMKLDATNKTQAAVKATCLGLLY